MAYCQSVLKKCQAQLCISKQILTVLVHAGHLEREKESKSLAGCCLVVAFVSFCSTLLLSTLQDSDHIQTSPYTQIVPFLEGETGGDPSNC